MTDLRLSASMPMLPSWDLARCAERLAGLGFAGIGVTRSAVEALGRRASVAALSASGLAVANYQQVDMFDVVTPARIDRARVLDDLDLAAEIGADCVYALAGPRGALAWNDAAGRLVEQIHDLLPELRGRRLRLALEPIHPLRQDLTFLSCLADVIDVLDLVDSPECGFVLDTWHVWWQRDVIDVIAANGPRMFSLQLSDHKPITLRTLDRAQLGDGIIPWGDLLNSIRASGYGGFFELEIISDDNEHVAYEGVLGTAAEWITSRWEPDGLR